MDDASVDEAFAEKFLLAHFSGARAGPEVADVELVGEGAWSRCFGFTLGGTPMVVRFGLHVEDFDKDRFAGSLHGPSLPIPTVTDVGRTGDSYDGYYAIATRVFGEPLESLTSAQWEAVMPSLFRALDAMRSIVPPSGCGYGGWGADGVGVQPSWRAVLAGVDGHDPADRTPGWRQRMATSPRAVAEFRRGLELMDALADALPADDLHLVHGDPVNRNILVADGSISGVFDWGCSFWGDHLYDIALIEFWSPWYPTIEALRIWQRARHHFDEIGLIVPDLEERMRCCLIHIGVDHIRYNAFLGKWKALDDVVDRLEPFLD